MRRDTQIGIILGVVILVVIGIFLSTRTTVYETKTPDLKISEEEIVAESDIEEIVEIEEIDMNDLIEESKTAVAKEDVQSVERLVEKTPVEPSNDNVTLEGKWEGTKTASIEPEEAFSEMISEEPEIADLIPPEVEETIDAVDTEQEDYSVKTIHKVISNDSLFKIARKYYGDEAKWRKIYEVNKDNMSGPNALYIGQELLVPEITLAKKVILSIETPLKKHDNEMSINATWHTVVSGDTLYHLARKYYDDSTMWHKIYEANEDTIEDESFLVKGQILIIPE